jgi:hypothetical protein
MSDVNPPASLNDQNGTPSLDEEAVVVVEETVVVEEPMPPARKVNIASRSQALQVLGGLSALGVLAWLLNRLRLRRQPTPSERLASSAQAVGTASLALGGRAADKLVSAAAPVGERAGELTRRGAQVGAEVAQRTAATAAPVVAAAVQTASRQGRHAAAQAASLTAGSASDLAERAGDVAGKAAKAGTKAGKSLTSSLAVVPETVVEGGEVLQKKWRKVTRRLTILIFGGAGYVLGARAGRERYDQIMRAVGKVAQRPEVQQAKDKVSGTPPTQRNTPSDPAGQAGSPFGHDASVPLS